MSSTNGKNVAYSALVVASRVVAGVFGLSLLLGALFFLETALGGISGVLELSAGAAALGAAILPLPTRARRFLVGVWATIVTIVLLNLLVRLSTGHGVLLALMSAISVCLLSLVAYANSHGDGN